MNAGEKNARIVCRMKSVDVTRVIPSRWAVSVAIVDLPVPVAPPTRRMIGMSSWRSAWSRRRRRIVRLPSASPSTSEASSPNRSRSRWSEPRVARSASARRARSYAFVTVSPVAASARAMSPFDHGGPSSPPSGSGAR